MTDFNSILDSITNDGFTVEEVREYAIAHESIDILGVYDYHTGGKIGTFESNVLTFAIEEEACEDLESLADALIVRCVASMRPSPALNKPDRHTIRKLVLSQPVNALAYLLNRLYHPLSLKRSAEESFTALRGRIQMHEKVMSLDTDVLYELTHWMLEMDSTFNLSVHRELPIKLPFESFMENPSKFTESVLRYLCAHPDAYVNGNRLANLAYLESYFDRPDLQHKKEVMKRPLGDTFGNRKTASGATKKVSKLQQKVAVANDLLATIMNRTAAPTTETPKPRAPLALKSSNVVMGGQLFANRKKES